MSNKSREKPNVYKWLSVICLVIIPIAGSIAIVFNFNRDPFQLLLMSLGFLLLSWTNWSNYKENPGKRN